MKPHPELLEQIAERLKALADPCRLRILHALEGGELSVQEIQDRVGSSQANISKHLARLRRSGIVAPRRSGHQVLYRVVDAASFTICRTVCRGLERELERAARLLQPAGELRPPPEPPRAGSRTGFVRGTKRRTPPSARPSRTRPDGA